MDIARDLGEVRIEFNSENFVPSLVEMPDPFMSAIIVRGLGDSEVAHEFAKIAQGCLGQDVPMIMHQHKSVQDDAIGIYRMREDI